MRRLSKGTKRIRAIRLLHLIELRCIFEQPSFLYLGNVSDICLASSLHDLMEYHPVSLPILPSLRVSFLPEDMTWRTLTKIKELG